MDYIKLIISYLPNSCQKFLKKCYAKFSYFRGIWIPIQIRILRETWASLIPLTKIDNGLEPKVLYMTGMPRTGSSLAKNFLGNHDSFEVMKFQSGGFTFAWERALTTEKIVVDKATHYVRNIRKIHRTYGDSVTFFCIVRDPRDELLSLIESNKHREIPRNESFWQEWHQTYMNLLDFAAEHSDCTLNIYLIRYEDLVRWPIQAKVDFLSWLGLEIKVRTINPQYNILHDDDIQDSKVEKKRKVSTDSVGRWKDVTDPKVRKLLNHWQYVEPVKSMMGRFGYNKGGVVDHQLSFKGIKVFRPQIDNKY